MKSTDVLADQLDEREINGVNIRKGSVGAFLGNAAIWLDGSTSDAKRIIAESDLIELIPAMQALSVFEIFNIKMLS